MYLSRTRFFILLFFLLPGPFIAQKLLWLAFSQRTTGIVYFTGHTLELQGNISDHLVILFRLGHDSVYFNANVDGGLPDDTPVAVRYNRYDPTDARIDLPLCIWGDTLVYSLFPLVIWLVLLLTPERFAPLIPRRSTILLRLRPPFIKVLPPIALGRARPARVGWRARQGRARPSTSRGWPFGRVRRVLFPLAGSLLLCGLSAQAQKDTVTLKKATVTAVKPVIIQKPDRIIVNVDAMIAQTGSNTLELLEKLPGVMVDPNGIISLNGRTGVLVLIDDKPTYLGAGDLANYLRSLPAGMLDRIELLSNPPARYDAASGAGVIIIRTKKNKEKGFNLQASAGYGQAVYGRTNEGVTANWRKGKVNVFANLSYSWQHSFRRVEIDRWYYAAGGAPLSFFTETAYNNPVRVSKTVKTGMDYSVSPKTTIGFVLTGVYNTTTNHTPVTSSIFDAGHSLDSVTNAANSSHDHFSNQGVNLNFSHAFHRPGASLTADADYVTHKALSTQLFLNTTVDAAGSVLSVDDEQAHLPTEITIRSAKTDYTQPLGRHGRLEAGGKISSVSSDNIAGYFYLRGDSALPDNDKTNHFIYWETIEAVYLNLTREVKRFSFEGGLRLENTEARGHQLGNTVKPDSSFTRQYTDLFPTAYISYAVDTAGRNHLRLSYGRRINRPNYQDLNPFVFLINRFTYASGNPYLKPQYSDNLEFSWQYRNTLTATVFYNYTRDVQQEVIRANGKIFISETGNIGHHTGLGLSVNARLQPLKNWSVNLFSQAIDSRYVGVIGDSALNTNTVAFSFNCNNQLAVGDWAADVSGIYNGRVTDGQFVKAAVWMITAGISRKMLHRKASLRLVSRDLFHTFQPRGTLTNIPGVAASFRNYVDTQVVGLAFTYSFSSGKTGKARKTGSSQDEQDRIGN